ncbi:HAD-IA family hydrolase [Halalkalibacter alkaliphilus]|uniref:HAD-IA family hydrolase n=1 Tax=Halalkalibacter alkaliphilus TaxID=2917993 RepID=A0A9X2A5L5_9BACI|nr:HAD-IA family hydrolase [Halalkalibacter alkaliphilus]MCL7745606.1 HAD-IA family hydrolase [Halalkalibacter alkaliphilus]
MPKYVLFDFDGTLADSRNVFISGWNAFAEKYQYRKIKFEELSSLRKLSILERAKRLNFPILKTPLIIPDFYRFYLKNAKEIKLYPRMKEVLDTLERQGHSTAIISSNSEDVIKEVLLRNQVFNISRVLSSNVIFGKDQLIQKFLKEHQLKKSDVIYVGDEQRDIIACKSAGIKVIWVSWGYDAKELVQEQNPDYLVYSPEELLEVVLEELGR